MEYLVTMTTHVPEGTSEADVADMRGTPAGVVADTRAGAAMRTRDAGQMQTMLDSLPMAPWLAEEITPLVPHPSARAAAGSRPAAARVGSS